MTIPVITQNQGITKPVLNTTLKILPTSTPSKMPNTAPNKLMITLSNKNCLRTSFLFPPIALIKPTSLVLSLTATNIIFIRPIAAPIKVIIPIAPAAPLMPAKKPMNNCANLSLLSMIKLSDSVGINFLAFLICNMASSIAGSNSTTLLTATPN